MLDYSVLAIAALLGLVAGYMIWTLVKVQRLVRTLQEILTKAEPEALKLIQSSTQLTENFQRFVTGVQEAFVEIEPDALKLIKSSSQLTENLHSKLSNSDRSNWVQGALLGLKIFQTIRK